MTNGARNPKKAEEKGGQSEGVGKEVRKGAVARVFLCRRESSTDGTHAGYWRRKIASPDCLTTRLRAHNDSLQAGVLLVIPESWIYCSVIFLVQQVLSESTLYIFLLPALRDGAFPRSSIGYCGVINIFLMLFALCVLHYKAWRISLFLS